MSRDHARKWFNAAVILGCLLVLGLGVARSLFIFAVVLICDYFNYGSRLLIRAGFGVLVLTVLVTVGLVPEPHEWRELGQNTIELISMIVRNPARG